MRWSLCFAILVGMSQSVTIVGAGLAGSEAALQLADRGVRVRLVEMRPKTPTLVHVTGCCAELVCSNSLKSEKPDSAAGMLKRELAELGSQLYAQAKLHAVPAGGALAVDRTAFAEAVTALVEAHPLIDLVHEEVVDLVRRDILVPSDYYSHVIPMEDVQRGFDLVANRKAFKVILQMPGTQEV